MSLEIKKKKDTVRSSDYLAYIRRLPCAVCVKLNLVQHTRTTPSHTIPKGQAKGSDLLAVNACLDHHPQSTRSANEVLEKAGINIERHIELLHETYTLARGIILDGLTLEQYLLNCGLAEACDGSQRRSRRPFIYYKLPF